MFSSRPLPRASATCEPPSQGPTPPGPASRDSHMSLQASSCAPFRKLEPRCKVAADETSWPTRLAPHHPSTSGLRWRTVNASESSRGVKRGCHPMWTSLRELPLGLIRCEECTTTRSSCRPGLLRAPTQAGFLSRAHTSERPPIPSRYSAVGYSTSSGRPLIDDRSEMMRPGPTRPPRIAAWQFCIASSIICRALGVIVWASS